jgi:hypothetical protein
MVLINAMRSAEPPKQDATQSQVNNLSLMGSILCACLCQMTCALYSSLRVLLPVCTATNKHSSGSFLSRSVPPSHLHPKLPSASFSP